MEQGNMKLSYGQMEQIAGQLENSAKSMSDILQEVTNCFNKIGNDGIWSGDAAESTKTEFIKLSGKFEEFTNAVMSCKTYLDNVVTNYKDVDRTINQLGNN